MRNLVSTSLIWWLLIFTANSQGHFEKIPMQSEKQCEIAKEKLDNLLFKSQKAVCIEGSKDNG